MMGTFLLLSVLLAPGVGTAANSSVGDSYVPISTIHSLLQQHSDLITMRATVTRNGNPIYVQDSTEGAAVEGVSSQDLKIGDQVLVTGSAEESDHGLLF